VTTPRQQMPAWGVEMRTQDFTKINL